MPNTVVRDPYEGRPIITIVESRLRAFGGSDINRTTARELLALYQHGGELSDLERQQVLLRFPVDVPPVPAHVHGVPVGRRLRARSIGGRS